jgi:hypothetical protein
MARRSSVSISALSRRSRARSACAPPEQARLEMPELLLPGRDLADQPLAEGQHLGELARGGVRRRRRRRPGKRAVTGDHLGIDPVGLGQPPARLGKVAHPLGVDDRDRQAACDQAPMRQALVTP